MSEQQNNTFDIQVKLTMMDYFRYYYSLFCLKISGLTISMLTAIAIIKCTSSLISLIRSVYPSGVLNWEIGKGILLNLLILLLFSIPFIKIYITAYKDAKAHKFLNKTIDVRITMDKLIVSYEGSKQEYSWKRMYRIFDLAHSFAPYIDKKTVAFILPKRCFKNKEQRKFIKDIKLKYSK